ncbi:DUF2867 domain-containing protein [Actinomycetospora termitidis]|uniref:DUF2867 domain-containing protein n=1 Tax=Actinomycetospora termitidis TaxID=3053470 RepID=A0ABT7MDR2_9PSEU|nr:DUF2867 domain-containing protein [Actinomycetospora sp. Odt1-22]MDL5158811.1 DUF2867 domain-containing protein [Actinomycetospora sp. Odt1-22]
MRCAVIGSTGYLGTRLVPRLLARGDDVAVLVRSPDKLALTRWAAEVDVVPGALEDRAAVARLVADADVVVHLAHALDRPDFPERDRTAAHVVADAATGAGVGRIVYLGGLRPSLGSVSRHLASRAEVADVFLASPVPTAALEAGIVVGSGSASFEMIRYLAERVPVLPAIPWLAHRTQPIAVDDVLHLLAAATLLPPEVDRRLDVGGPDVLTYLDLVQRYARLAGLPQRVAVPVPLPVPPGGPTVAAMAMELLSPLPRRLVEPLIESLRHELVCDPDSLADARRLLGDPPGGPTTYGAAVRAALGYRRDGVEPTDRDPAPGDSPADRPAALALPSDPVGSGGATWRWSTTARGPATPQAVWAAVQRIGGDTGWYAPPGVFAALGWADQLLGGVGGYRGRPHGRDLVVGDVVDGWRVSALASGQWLRLRADLKVPGRLWLTFTVLPDDGSGSALRLDVAFAPSGLAGVAYGAGLRVGAPLVFGPMARGALRAAAR